jgi:hypothetical protein
VDRRDFLVTMMQALLMALFPWLRSERGAQVAAQAAQTMVPVEVVHGWWAQSATWHMARSYNFTWRQQASELLGRPSVLDEPEVRRYLETEIAT